jgi:hypothetical protein
MARQYLAEHKHQSLHLTSCLRHTLFLFSEALDGFYTFVQTAVYNIAVGMIRQKLRDRELRARLLNLKK